MVERNKEFYVIIVKKQDVRKQKVVRFPPSPTGEWHFGTVRTFVHNYLFAKQNGGKIVMRFEDTDKARNKPESYQQQLDVLKRLGLNFDEGPFRQSERTEIYSKYLKKLVEEGKAYEAEENESKTGRVIRLKNVERDIIWNDLVKGEIKINTHSFKERDDAGNFSEEGNTDLVIARSMNDALYHFTVCVDDYLMGITHVLRGEDHVTSTPRQIIILEALGADIPQYGHLPTVWGEDKQKLSKRKGAKAVREYLDAGYLPDAILNQIALLGWNPGDNQEIFKREDLIKVFSLGRVQKHPAIYEDKKLDFINKGHLKFLSDEEFVQGVINAFPEDCREGINKNIEKARKIYLKVYRERISKFSEVAEAAKNGENNCFYDFSWNEDFKNFDLQNICFKNKDGMQSLEQAKENLKLVKENIQNIPDPDWTIESLKNIIWDWSGTVGRGQILHPLRMIMSLKEKSPDPFTIMEIVGKEESLRRLNSVI